jgi:hypothetical protein
MTDAAHVLNKTQQPLSESHDLTTIILTNPRLTPVSNYRTAIDPALIAAKPIQTEQRVLALDDMPIPTWLSYYGAGENPAELWHKASIMSGDIQQVVVGDGPWVNDIGPTADLGVNSAQPGLEDIWHQAIITDLYPSDTIIISAQFPFIPYLTSGEYVSQHILAPISSRHIVKTPDGVLHAICAYIIDSYSRIVYLKSVNGGSAWTSLVVDNGEPYMHYITPSITCDKNNNIHITYSRWDSMSCDTYWLFDGDTTPYGFELMSGVGDTFNMRVLTGGEGSYDANLLKNEHDHGCSLSISNGSCDGTAPVLWGHDMTNCGWHHDYTCNFGFGTSLPSYRTLKVLKYRGIPPLLPEGIIFLFDTDVPEGYTRYSEHDGYYIVGSDTAGVTGGASDNTHGHLIHSTLYNCSHQYKNYCDGDWWDEHPAVPDHSHTVPDFNTPSGTHKPPSYQIVLGKFTAGDTTVIPQHALILSPDPLVLPIITDISSDGKLLYQKCLVAGDSYEDAGGSSTHNHGNASGSSSAVYSPWSPWLGGGNSYTVEHVHVFSITGIDYQSNYPACFSPYISHVDEDIDCTHYSNDMFYRTITPACSLSSPINISQMYQYFPSFTGSCFLDSVDDVHFLWEAQGLNTTLSNSRVCYRKITSGVLGDRVDITTDDYYASQPSMDIDTNGHIHIIWLDYDGGILYYCNIVDGTVSDDEVVYSGDCHLPSNLVTDHYGNVYIAFSVIDNDPHRNVYYCKLSGGVWSSPVCLSPGMAEAEYQQAAGQIFVDNKSNAIVTFSGKGYGAHADVYHPVYRVIKSDGTVIPDLAYDATDMFPDDDEAIISPSMFWHSYPLVEGVYHNLSVSGFSVLYLFDLRGGITLDTADICFYSVPEALVGDVGDIGHGGSGDSTFTPGGVIAEGILQQESYTITQSGHICINHISPSLGGKSVL